MAIQPLVDTTGNTLADRIVQGIISLFEHVLPNALCSCYVEGSYANQNAVATSDLDLILVLHASLTTEREHTVVASLLEACQHLSTLELDVTLTDVSQLQQSADPVFKLGARLLFGHEIRDTIPLIPMTLWARQRMHAAFWLMIHVFQRPQPVVAPITFPQPDDPFYGYAARPMHVADGTEIRTTRNLIRITGWIATARIAHQAQSYVVEKRSCVTTYRARIGDEWTDLLETIDRRCRQAWQYRIPESNEEQKELRTIGHHVLAYENHFLNVYKQFLLQELTGNDVAAQSTGLAMLERTWYPEPAIVTVLHQLANSNQANIGAAAQQCIKQWQEIRFPIIA